MVRDGVAADTLPRALPPAPTPTALQRLWKEYSLNYARRLNKM